MTDLTTLPLTTQESDPIMTFELPCRAANLSGRLSIAWILVATFVGCNSPRMSDRAPSVDWQLAIVKVDGSSTQVTHSELVARDRVTVRQAKLQHHSGAVEVDDWSGVPLSTWFAGTHDVIARGEDGYEKIIPAEFVDGAIVALWRRDRSLANDPKVGPMRVVAPGVHGGSWVYNLVELREAQ